MGTLNNPYLQLQTFGQQPTMNGSVMAGYNPNITNPVSGLTPSLFDPTGVLNTGMLGTGLAGTGQPSIGDIGKQVASAPWGGNTSGMFSGFGMNIPSFALGLQGLNSLGSLYLGSKSLGLANKQFESAQKFADINMRNQTQTYNDTLESKLRRIGSFNGTNKEETEAEIARRKLPAYA
jgi:hypothetical protein